MGRRAAPPGGSQTRRGLLLKDWRPLVKGTLRYFATVELPIGLTIFDCPVLVSHGKVWVGLPAKPRLDRDQRPVTKNGKLQ